MFMWYVNSVMTQTGLHPESRLQPLLVDIRSKTAGSHLSSNGHAPATSRTEFMMQALDKDASTCLWMWVCMYVIVYPAGGWSLPEPGLLFKTLGGMSGRQLGQEQGVGGWGGVGVSRRLTKPSTISLSPSHKNKFLYHQWPITYFH